MTVALDDNGKAESDVPLYWDDGETIGKTTHNMKLGYSTHNIKQGYSKYNIKQGYSTHDIKQIFNP